MPKVAKYFPKSDRTDLRAPKFTDDEREEVLEKVALLNRRGYSQSQIAREIGVSQPQIKSYLETLRERHQTAQLKHHDEYVKEKLEELRDVRQRANEAYEWSMGRMTRFLCLQIAQQLKDKPGLEKVEIQLPKMPANEFLKTVLACIEAECDLLGVKPEKVEKHAHVHVEGQERLSWDVFAQNLGLGNTSDTVSQGTESPLETTATSLPVSIDSMKTDEK